MDDAVIQQQSLESFDYHALPEPVRAQLLDIFYRLRSLFRRSCEDIVEIGRLLLESSELLGSQFESWIKSEFNLSYSTARRFMLAAKKSEVLPELKALQPSVLYMLAEPSVTDDVIAEVIQKAKAGAVKVKEIEEAIRKSKILEERARHLEEELDHALSEAADLRTRLKEAEQARDDQARRLEIESRRAANALETLNRRSAELREAEEAYEEIKKELARLKSQPPKVEIREVQPPPGELEKRKKVLEAQCREMERQVAALRKELERGKAELEKSRQRTSDAAGNARMAAVASQQAARLLQDLATAQGLVEAHAATPEILGEASAEIRAAARSAASKARALSERLVALAEALEALK